MANLKISKVTALPGTLDPDTIYIVSTGAPYAELYITTTDGLPRRVPNSVDIQAMIDSSLAGISGGATIVNDITARNALTPTNGQMVLVIDASADGTVTSGAATYVYRTSTTSWIKVSEHESLDVSLSWAALTGKPTASAAAIDAAVTASHSHTNKTQLDEINEDGSENLTYKGSRPTVEWTATGW